MWRRDEFCVDKLSLKGLRDWGSGSELRVWTELTSGQWLELWCGEGHGGAGPISEPCLLE